MKELKKKTAVKKCSRKRTKEEAFFRDVVRPESAFYGRIKADALATGMSMRAVTNIWLADACAMRFPATEDLVAVMKGRPAGAWFSSASLEKMKARNEYLEAENRMLRHENEQLKQQVSVSSIGTVGFFFPTEAGV